MSKPDKEKILFSSIRDQFEMFECTFAIESDGSVRNERVQAPRAILEQQFLQLMQQAAESPQPVKVKMSRTVPFYDTFNKEWVNREHGITFINNAYIKIKGENF